MWEVRPIAPEEASIYRARISRGFGADPEQEEGADERFLSIFDPDRMLAVFDGGDIVGTGGAITMDVTLPGGRQAPMGGTTVITVQPTHRRRGVLRSLMDRHLQDIRDRDEPLAGLWASESTIYGRFGYGPATFRHEVTVDSNRAPASGPGVAKLRLVTLDEVAPAIRAVYERARPGRAGMLTRSEGWWTNRVLRDSERYRGGKSEMRCVVAEVGGEPAGYAMYRQERKWDEPIADGLVDVEELVTDDPAVRADIWTFLTHIDLFPRLAYWNMALDDPLTMLVSEPRAVKCQLADALWIRIMDVPRALEARSYEVDGMIEMSVVDPAGVTEGYRLEVEGGVGRCTRVEDADGVELELGQLARLYLGGGDAVVMSGAGLISGRPESVSAVNRIFRTETPPWCPEVF